MKIKNLVIFLGIIVSLLFVGIHIKSLEGKEVVETKIQSNSKMEITNDLQEHIKKLRSTLIPEVEVLNLENKKITIGIENEKPKVYIFWASWCSDCKRELPKVEKIFKEYGKQVDFITVNMTGLKGETDEDAKLYYQENRFTFPVYFDINQQVYKKFEIKAIPTIYFVTRSGIIKNIKIEDISEEDFKNEINTILNI